MVHTATSAVLGAADADGDPLTFSIVTNGSKGTAVIQDPTAGDYTYTSGPDATGEDRFTFKVNDGTADSGIATITVFIRPTINLPILIPVGTAEGRYLHLLGNVFPCP